MIYIVISILRLLSLAPIVQCLRWEGRNPMDDSLGQPQPPPPTPAPLARLVRKQEAGDSACGYFQYAGLSEIYCASQWVCATNNLKAYGCCDRATLDDCPLHTACLDSTAVSNGVASNPQVLSCASAAAPFCATGYLQLGAQYTALGCQAEQGIVATIYSTYPGYTPVTYFNAFYNPSQTALTAPNQASATPGSSSASTPLPFAPTSSTSSTSSTPIGAIVGGVVGGVAVIIIVAAVVFLIIYFSKKKKSSTETHVTTGPGIQEPKAYPPPAPSTTYPLQPPNPTLTSPDPSGYQAPYPAKAELQNQGYMPSAPPQHEQVLPSSNHYSLVPPYSPQPSVALPAVTPSVPENVYGPPQVAPPPQGNLYGPPQGVPPPQENFYELPQGAPSPQGNLHELPHSAPPPQGNFYELPEAGR